MGSKLDQILEAKYQEIEHRKKLEPISRKEVLERTPDPASFSGALLEAPMGLIAEVKRRSPSAGPIREPFDPEEVALAYRRSGAQAISCLVDHAFFGGGEADFEIVLRTAGRPQLYKEFVIDPWQVWHARSIGASAVLLIVAALPRDHLQALHGEILEMGMEPLVEVHDAAEMEVALEMGADIIGINNRNLKTFTVDLTATEDLAHMAGHKKLLISESGIRTPDDVVRVRDAGCRAVLVGEQLLRQADPGEAVTALMGKAWAFL